MLYNFTNILLVIFSKMMLCLARISKYSSTNYSLLWFKHVNTFYMTLHCLVAFKILSTIATVFRFWKICIKLISLCNTCNSCVHMNIPMMLFQSFGRFKILRAKISYYIGRGCFSVMMLISMTNPASIFI